MTNYSVFGTANNPLNVKMVNTYQSPGIISPPETSAGQSGALYAVNASASALVVLSLISAIASIRIANAPGSGKTIYLSRIIGSIGGSSLLSSMSGNSTIVKGGTLTSPTTLTPVNTNFGSANTSVMTAQSSTTAITGGTSLLSYQLAPGSYTLDYTGRIVIPPGNALSVNVTSSSSTVGLTIVSTVTVFWWEA